MRLLKYGTCSEPDDHLVLARGHLGLGPEGEGWQPERLSFFIEPSRFNLDKGGRYWCLISKAEATQMYHEWIEDPKYTEAEGPSGHNYFKNQVDEFKHQLENRKWSP